MEAIFRQRGEMPTNNHGLCGHSFQFSVQMKMEKGNCADSSARICLRKIAFGSEFPVPQSEWARAEAIASAAPQQRKALPTELSEERRKVRQMGLIP
jgi:hypothetical protein